MWEGFWLCLFFFSLVPALLSRWSVELYNCGLGFTHYCGLPCLLECLVFGAEKLQGLSLTSLSPF